jgi:hypothetical protein
MVFDQFLCTMMKNNRIFLVLMDFLFLVSKNWHEWLILHKNIDCTSQRMPIIEAKTHISLMGIMYLYCGSMVVQKLNKELPWMETLWRGGWAPYLIQKWNVGFGIKYMLLQIFKY